LHEIDKLLFSMPEQGKQGSGRKIAVCLCCSFGREEKCSSQHECSSDDDATTGGNVLR
jgi:hypothetical protein